MTRPGAYVLLFGLAQDEEIEVGRLGTVRFQRGHYGYVGSAMGSGGLDARIARHLRAEKNCHWHIDHLLARASVSGALELETVTRIECALSDALDRGKASTTPVRGFGSSDCRCRSHLRYFGASDLDEDAAGRAARLAVLAAPGLESGAWRAASG
ncbi:MAG: GIY-YIG nuclease family protein [Dehalococcoidia bacterium]|jgi:Uri superfamily endonuclease|nr:GIY-YIG nuclease family protein [Dehalococcoidia bacterium]